MKPADNLRSYTGVVRTKNDVDRSGKIDLAVYEDANGIEVSVCAIEFKGFDPAKDKIVDDLLRNAEYFLVTPPTDSSVIQFTVFAAFHQYRGVWGQEKECKNIEKVRKRYEKYIKENSGLNHLSHEIEVFTLRRGTAPSVDEPSVLKLGLHGDEDCHYIGVVVVASKI